MSATGVRESIAGKDALSSARESRYEATNRVLILPPSLPPSLSLSLYIYICVCVCVCVRARAHALKAYITRCLKLEGLINESEWINEWRSRVMQVTSRWPEWRHDDRKRGWRNANMSRIYWPHCPWNRYNSNLLVFIFIVGQGRYSLGTI